MQSGEEQMPLYIEEGEQTTLPPKEIRLSRPRFALALAGAALAGAALFAVVGSVVVGSSFTKAVALNDVSEGDGSDLDLVSLIRQPVIPSKPKVIFIQDSCLDDFLTIAALARAHKAGEIEWLADIVINGDSVLPQSMDITQTFHHELNVTDVPVFLSRVRLFNGFPWMYRNDTWAMATLESMKGLMERAKENGGIPFSKMDCGGCSEEYPDPKPWLVKTLKHAQRNSITILNVATQTIMKDLFETRPKLMKKVKEMVWMAGAINVPGNTESSWEEWAKGHGYSGMNNKAEWNVYGDAYAAKWFLEKSPFPIYDIPLDVCDQIPVCNPISCDFIKLMNGTLPSPDILGPECPNGLIFDALNEAYAKFAAPQPFYRLWDSAAATYVLKPEYFKDEGTTKLACITDWGYEGWLAQPGAPTSNGLEEPKIYKDVNAIFNLASKDSLSELYVYLASAACGTPAP